VIGCCASRNRLPRAACSYHFVIAVWRAKEAKLCGVKRSWKIIADNLSNAGWNWGCVSAVDSQGERSGLQTHIAATESVSLCALMKC
jgi:hypothetical protein